MATPNITPTSPENKARIEAFFSDESFQRLMSNLYGRWADESKYEDINAYAAPIEKILPEGFVITKMNKRPFGFQFSIGTDATYEIYMSTSSLGWRRIK